VILATVGTQLPFPRLIRALDDLAPSLGRVVAQIGDNPETPRHLEHHRAMEPRAFDELFRQADRVVAHAGIGTLLAAKKHHKPIIIFPRRAAMGEHRNDHQLATAKQLESHAGVYVAYDEQELERLLRLPDLTPPDDAPGMSLRDLQGAIREFIVS
jgi:UDP-N-acetylglucosamine transferase subunit ALG13